jgi:uncharacterized membrane protein
MSTRPMRVRGHPDVNDMLEVREVRVAHALNALSVLGTFAVAILGHAAQPDRVPVHFGLAGVPDRWADKSWGNTLAVPLVAVGITALIYASAQLVGWARKHPDMLNLPDKAAFLALPPELQAPIWRHMKAMAYWLAVPVIVVFLGIEVLTVRATEAGTLQVWPMIALTGLITGLIFVLLAVLTIRLSRAVRRAVAAGARRTPT